MNFILGLRSITIVIISPATVSEKRIQSLILSVTLYMLMVVIIIKNE